MAGQKMKVQCTRCREYVDKGQAQRVPSANRIEYHYECGSCYLKLGAGIDQTTAGPRRDFFCGRCRYKFSSRVTVCPYCAKGDQLDLANLKLGELL